MVRYLIDCNMYCIIFVESLIYFDHMHEFSGYVLAVQQLSPTIKYVPQTN